jgi:PPK2 family polyphosphate:nucleotide phosphotransferase
VSKRQGSLKTLRKLAAPYRVDARGAFRLRHVDPADDGGLGGAAEALAQRLLEDGVAHLARLQEKLYAQGRWSLLLVFQAMDAAGKDSAIEHVMSGVNPQGCQVFSFKAPSADELAHDFLWRCAKALPERGRIGIFNRSHYEEVIAVRVHPELLAAQRLPAPLVGRDLWDERCQDIRGFERHLARNGTVIRKFFLHVSKKEQKKRLLERLEDPDKHWKFSASDLEQRALWKRYMDAYEAAIRATATPYAPWYAVPADNKWYTRMVVAAAIVEALENLELEFPAPTPEQEKALEAARKALAGG